MELEIGDLLESSVVRFDLVPRACILPKVPNYHIQTPVFDLLKQIPSTLK